MLSQSQCSDPKAPFTLPTKASVSSKFRMKFWCERVDPAAHLELRQFSYSGWKRWINDPDLTLRWMKSSVKGLLWGISRSSARREGKGCQNSNSVMLNDGRHLLNIATGQYIAEKINNCHPRPVPTPQICLIPSLKMKIFFDMHVIFAVAAALPCG